MLKPTETLYVAPKPVAIADATVQNAGYFIGLRAASDPEKKGDLPWPIMVVHKWRQEGDLGAEAELSSGPLRQRKENSFGVDERVRLW